MKNSYLKYTLRRNRLQFAGELLFSWDNKWFFGLNVKDKITFEIVVQRVDAELKDFENEWEMTDKALTTENESRYSA